MTDIHWTKGMDKQLSLLVEDHSKDFDAVANAFQAWIEDMFEGMMQSELFDSSLCQTRWCTLSGEPSNEPTWTFPSNIPAPVSNVSAMIAECILTEEEEAALAADRAEPSVTQDDSPTEISTEKQPPTLKVNLEEVESAFWDRVNQSRKEQVSSSRPSRGLDLESALGGLNLDAILDSLQRHKQNGSEQRLHEEAPMNFADESDAKSDLQAEVARHMHLLHSAAHSMGIELGANKDASTPADSSDFSSSKAHHQHQHHQHHHETARSAADLARGLVQDAWAALVCEHPEASRYLIGHGEENMDLRLDMHELRKRQESRLQDMETQRSARKDSSNVESGRILTTMNRTTHTAQQASGKAALSRPQSQSAQARRQNDYRAASRGGGDGDSSSDEEADWHARRTAIKRASSAASRR